MVQLVKSECCFEAQEQSRSPIPGHLLEFASGMEAMYNHCHMPSSMIGLIRPITYCFYFCDSQERAIVVIDYIKPDFHRSGAL